MNDHTLRSFLQSGDPAENVEDRRLEALQASLMQQIALTEQEPSSSRPVFLPRRFLVLSRGFAFGVLLCGAGVLAGRLVALPLMAQKVVQVEEPAPTVLALASPWGEWIGE